MNNEFKRIWKEAIVAYPGICLEGLRKSTKKLSQDSRSLGRDLNLSPPEYEAGVLTTRLRNTITICKSYYKNGSHCYLTLIKLSR
jgi:hypothetical protein